MISYTCQTCGGEYINPQEDGTEYYHACPKVEISEGVYVARTNARDENIGVQLEGLGSVQIAVIEI